MKLYIGGGEPQGITIQTFTPDCVYANAISDKPKILYGEFLGLSKQDIEFVLKNGDKNTILVVYNKSFLKGIKIPKNVEQYKNYENEEYNPFEVGKSIFNNSDRHFVFNFLVKNKVALFLIIKIMVSHASTYQLDHPNRKVVEVLDYFYGKINPEILYAMIAYTIKPDNRRRTEWRYPKKEK